MDIQFDQILGKDEKMLWQGKPKHSVLLAGLVFSLLITVGISAYFFSQEVIEYTSNDVPKEISGSLVAAVILGVGLLISFLSYFSRKALSYGISNKRTIIKSGLIGSDFQSINFDQIKNVIVNVGPIGKLFNVGTIKIDTGKTETYSTSSGSGNNSSSNIRTRTMFDELKHIEQPYEVYKYFQETLDQRKESLYSGQAYQENHPL